MSAKKIRAESKDAAPPGKSLGSVAIDTVRQVAMEFAGIGLLRIRVDGTIQYLDRTALRVLGIEDRFPDHTQAVNLELSALIGPSPLDELLAKPSILRNHKVTITPAGGTERTLVLDVYFVRDQDTGEELAQGLIRESSPALPSEDVQHAELIQSNERISTMTEARAAATTALERSEEQYRTTIDSMHDAIHVVDRNLRIILMNKRLKLWCQELGLTPDGEGKTIFEVFPFLADTVRDQYGRVLDDGQVVISEETSTVSGESIITETRRIPVFDDGDVVRVVTVIRDVTSRTEAQNEITRLNRDLEKLVDERTEQLEMANRELESFASSVSHDLRTPLTAIKGFCQALELAYGQKLDERGLNFIQRMLDASTRMESLIDDLLSLSRVNKSELNKTKVDLSAIATEIVSSLWADDPERTVETAIEAGIVVHGDERLLRVLLENLLANAWKFSRKRELAHIEFGVITGSQAHPVLFVRDNGAGFAMSNAAKLFLPFQRLHSNKDFPGTGIGLATVRRVVERHGGRIWAESGLDEGATFFFTL